MTFEQAMFLLAQIANVQGCLFGKKPTLNTDKATKPVLGKDDIIKFMRSKYYPIPVESKK
ncbi:MAG: hypothetical protein OEY10_00380 [Nitrosopumilus sp.]|nr:hypothetical protein [Nitrosopumilus sp.]